MTAQREPKPSARERPLVSFLLLAYNHDRFIHEAIEGAFAQDKLVRVSRGRIFGIAVDIRKGSPGFCKWIAIEISADAWNQILVPKGFAHGFLTVEPDTEVLYKVTSPYFAEHDRAIRFNDPDIGINWPINKADIQISGKDQNAPFLKDIETGFVN